MNIIGTKGAQGANRSIWSKRMAAAIATASVVTASMLVSPIEEPANAGVRVSYGNKKTTTSSTTTTDTSTSTTTTTSTPTTTTTSTPPTTDTSTPTTTTTTATDFVTASSLAEANSLISSVAPGQTIKLTSGVTGTLTISGKTFSPAITIDATDATLTAIVIRSSNGVKFRGGTIVGGGRDTHGINIGQSSDIDITGMNITATDHGIVVYQTKGMRIADNKLYGLISDGIDLAESREIAVTGNSCRDFNPAPRIYDASGVMIQDGDHADCIQAWSRPTSPPTSDIQIIGNYAEGEMQGIFLGNKVRDGVNDGGFDRITIKNNYVDLALGNGIRIVDGRGSIIEGNKVYTIDGSTIFDGTNYFTVKTNLSVAGGYTQSLCGNYVEKVPTAPGQGPC